MLFIFFWVFVSCFSPHKGNGETIFVSNKHDILRVEVGPPSNVSTVVSADLPISSFDLHHTWGHVYWATDYHIYRTPLYDSQTTTELAATGRVGTLAVDWLHNHLYWTDLSAARVESAQLDGGRRRVVLETGGVIASLVLDPQVGRLFWCESNDGGVSGEIKSCNLDGSAEKTVYSSQDVRPDTPLALDLEFKSAYFYTRSGLLSEQWEISYGGGAEPPIKLFEREESPARSLGLGEGGFYYSTGEGLLSGTWVRKTITLAYGDNMTRVVVLEPSFETLNETLTNVVQIRVWGETGQPLWEGTSGAHQRDHDCAPLTNTTCVCSFGYSLLQEQSTCAEDGYLLYSTKTGFKRSALNGDKETVLYNDSSVNMQAFDAHIQSGHLYWSDSAHKAIYRAPIGAPLRKEVIVSDITAYGVAVDWLHNHIYWTEDSRVCVASLRGSKRMVLLTDRDDPSDIAVDPINRYIFWVECGVSLSIWRALLDGSQYQAVVPRHVTCSATLTADPKSRTLYWLDWAGSVYSADYDGCAIFPHFMDLMSPKIGLGNRVLWTKLDDLVIRVTTGDIAYQKLNLNSTQKVTAVRKIHSSYQPAGHTICEDTDCTGLCLLSLNEIAPMCHCPDGEGNLGTCSDNQTRDSSSSSVLQVVDVSSFSVTLRCSDVILRHAPLPFALSIIEEASLVPRDSITKIARNVSPNKTVIIEDLNPATSYVVSVRNRVRRGSAVLTVHTAPPPLAVERLPVVTVPGAVVGGGVSTAHLKWLKQGVHYFSPNVWESLLPKEYILLLISKMEVSQADSPVLEDKVLALIRRQVQDNFVVLKHYKSKEEFDDDPAMNLGNIPWGEQFWLAMLQVLQYRGSYHLDVVYSERFALPVHGRNLQESCELER